MLVTNPRYGSIWLWFASRRVAFFVVYFVVLQTTVSNHLAPSQRLVSLL